MIAGVASWQRCPMKERPLRFAPNWMPRTSGSATGAPLEEANAADTASLRAAIGIDEFDAVRARLD